MDIETSCCTLSTYTIVFANYFLMKLNIVYTYTTSREEAEKEKIFLYILNGNSDFYFLYTYLKLA